MAETLYISFTALGEGPAQNGAPFNVPTSLVGDTAEVSPTAASLAGGRISVNADAVALAYNIGDTAMKMSIGADPDATADARYHFILPGREYPVAVKAGDLIDAVLVT